MVRAKFVVVETKQTMGSKSVPYQNEDGTIGGNKSVPCEMTYITMQPVYGNGDPNHENTKFWQASPNGELKLGCVNPEAVAELKVGKEFYVDFTVAA